MPRTTPAADRARRLIALLGRLEDGARLPIDTLAEELGTTPKELAEDLESLSMCGVAPYDPGTLVPVIVEDGFVEVWGDVPAVKGSVRLSSAEASALASALQTAGFTAEDPLTAKLLSASSTDFDPSALEHTIRTAIAGHDREVYETLAAAARDSELIDIDYSTGGTGEAECRRVEPVALFAERGAWYLSAWCHTAGTWRTFRVDRMRSARPIGERFEPRRDAPVPRVALVTEGLPLARLRFSVGEEFTEREWPGARVVSGDDDGTMLVDVPYAGTAWIARRVAARLGAVEVLAPEEVRAAVREAAARP